MNNTTAKESQVECRIYYQENWLGQRGEFFVFETKRTDEDEWGIDTAFEVIDNKISYTALTKIREYQRQGVIIHFV